MKQPHHNQSVQWRQKSNKSEKTNWHSNLRPGISKINQ